MSYQKLPDFVSNKKPIINIQNKKDNKCFVWSILRFLHPTEVSNHPERLTDLKQYKKDLNFKCITFPIKWEDITKFEKQNPNIKNILNIIHAHIHFKIIFNLVY